MKRPLYTGLGRLIDIPVHRRIEDDRLKQLLTKYASTVDEKQKETILEKLVDEYFLPGSNPFILPITVVHDDLYYDIMYMAANDMAFFAKRFYTNGNLNKAKKWVIAAVDGVGYQEISVKRGRHTPMGALLLADISMREHLYEEALSLYKTVVYTSDVNETWIAKSMVTADERTAAHMALGRMYEEGIGTDKNIENAMAGYEEVLLHRYDA
jgi:hypothetical protein